MPQLITGDIVEKCAGCDIKVATIVFKDIPFCQTCACTITIENSRIVLRDLERVTSHLRTPTK